MMATDTKTVKASCLCGSVGYDITLPTSAFPLVANFCHCSSCRHMSGTLCFTLASLPDSYEPPSDILAKCTLFHFSRRILQYFCEICGSQMLSWAWMDADNHVKGGHWDVMTGSLDHVDGIWDVVAHEFVADTLDGGFADFFVPHNRQIPRSAGWPGKSEELPLYWYSTDRVGVDAYFPSEKLHARCKCGGVSFFVARPSERSKNAGSYPYPDLLIPHHSNKPATPGIWWVREQSLPSSNLPTAETLSHIAATASLTSAFPRYKFLAGVCACNSCRLATGVEWLEWAFIPSFDMFLDKEGKKPFSLPFGTLKEYQSSPGITRYHCGTCGATAFFQIEERMNVLDVAVGLLDAPEGARAETWLDWTTQRLSFREDSLPRAERLTLAVEHGLEGYGKRKARA